MVQSDSGSKTQRGRLKLECDCKRLKKYFSHTQCNDPGSLYSQNLMTAVLHCPVREIHSSYFCQLTDTFRALQPWVHVIPSSELKTVQFVGSFTTCNPDLEGRTTPGSSKIQGSFITFLTASDKDVFSFPTTSGRQHLVSSSK